MVKTHMIKSPNENDVLCGRGGFTNTHPGNAQFRSMVDKHKRVYLNARFQEEKRLIASTIVADIRDLDPPGRFLAKDNKTGAWFDIGDEKARDKTLQALRENAPSIRAGIKGESQPKPKRKKKAAASTAPPTAARPPYPPMQQAAWGGYNVNYPQQPGVVLVVVPYMQPPPAPQPMIGAPAPHPGPYPPPHSAHYHQPGPAPPGMVWQAVPSTAAVGHGTSAGTSLQPILSSDSRSIASAHNSAVGPTNPNEVRSSQPAQPQGQTSGEVYATSPPSTYKQEDSTAQHATPDDVNEHQFSRMAQPQEQSSGRDFVASPPRVMRDLSSEHRAALEANRFQLFQRTQEGYAAPTTPTRDQDSAGPFATPNTEANSLHFQQQKKSSGQEFAASPPTYEQDGTKHHAPAPEAKRLPYAYSPIKTNTSTRNLKTGSGNDRTSSHSRSSGESSQEESLLDEETRQALMEIEDDGQQNSSLLTMAASHILSAWDSDAMCCTDPDDQVASPATRRMQRPSSSPAHGAPET